MKNGIRFQLCMVLCFAMLASFSAFAQSSGDVKIGNQIWMSKNLDVSTFRNGEPIPQAKNKDEWLNASKSKSPVWCYYDFDENNGKKYGKLYNWYAVIDPRGLAPKGYHVPSNDEWKELIEFLGGENIAGKKMKSIEGWKSSNDNFLGDNSSGFSCLPGGHCSGMSIMMNFNNIGKEGYWWTTTIYEEEKAWKRIIYYDKNKVSTNSKWDLESDFGCSVRCIKE
jgi:uncharacterized protein (TIGR02145 family)